MPFKNLSHYHISVRSNLLQKQFFYVEDALLFKPPYSSGKKAFGQFYTPRLKLSFYLPNDLAEYELPRVLHVFSQLFRLKPKVARDLKGYEISADFSGYLLDILLGGLMSMHRKTKYLKFFYDSSTVRMILDEPLTFFPVTHSEIDFHDWNFPFSFQLSFGSPNYPPYNEDQFEKLLVRFFRFALVFFCCVYKLFMITVALLRKKKAKGNRLFRLSKRAIAKVIGSCRLFKLEYRLFAHFTFQANSVKVNKATCMFTGRGRGYVSDYLLSRLEFKARAMRGSYCGLKKFVWLSVLSVI